MKLFILILLCLVSPLSADDFHNSGYVHVGLGERLIPSADVNHQFDLGSSGGLSQNISNEWDVDLDLAVGYQSSHLWGLELGAGGGAGGASDDFTAEVTAGYPGSSHDYIEGLSYGSFYAMPLIRIPMHGLFQRPSFHTFGVQIGYATLFGDLTTYSPSYASSTVSKTHAESTSYALCYRLEQMLGRRTSLGLELRYQWVSFQPYYANGYRVTNMDGSPLTLDLSGPSIKLSVDFWFVRPFANAAEEAAAAEAKAKRQVLIDQRRNDLKQEAPAEAAVLIARVATETKLRLVLIDGSVLRGTLLGYDAEVLTLEVKGKAKEIPMDQIRKAFDASTDLPYKFTVADEVSAPVVEARETKAERRARINKELGPNVLNKAWYIYDAIGVASYKYPTGLQNTIDANLAGGGDVSRLPMSLELLGFYYSWRPHNLLVGLVVDGGSDSYQPTKGTPIFVDESLYAVSFMYFPWQGVGRGVFFRGDFGYADMAADGGVSFSLSNILASHDGYGGLLGIGYAFPIARKFSIMVTADDMLLRMQDETYDSPRLNVGILF